MSVRGLTFFGFLLFLMGCATPAQIDISTPGSQEREIAVLYCDRAWDKIINRCEVRLSKLDSVTGITVEFESDHSRPALFSEIRLNAGVYKVDFVVCRSMHAGYREQSFFFEAVGGHRYEFMPTGSSCGPPPPQIRDDTTGEVVVRWSE